MKTQIDYSTEARQLAETIGSEKEHLIPLLQEIQRRHGYLPQELLEEVCKATRFSEAELFGVATFYSQFRFTPRGKYSVKVCTGTACHVGGAAAIVDVLREELHIDVGQTTPDQRYSLETVACLGCCSLGPVMMVNGETVGQLDPLNVHKTLQQVSEDRS